MIFIYEINIKMSDAKGKWELLLVTKHPLWSKTPMDFQTDSKLPETDFVHRDFDVTYFCGIK